MNKIDLVASVAAQTGLNKDKADTVVSSFIEQITNALNRNESVALIGFGTFSPAVRAARSGRNPRTGAVIEIAARKNVVFKPGKALKAAVSS